MLLLQFFKVDKENGLISTVVIDTGGSSALVRDFRVGEPIIFMGPSGSSIEMHRNKNIMLIGGGRGVFPLSSIAKKYKENGCKVILCIGYKKNSDITLQRKLEDSCDILIISIEENPEIAINRKQDVVYHGNIVNAVIDYGKGVLGYVNLNYRDIDLMYCMGNENMMDRISQIKHKDLKDYLNPKHIGIASLNNPMQCMMKGVCSQCLQKKINSKTGEESYFYSCIKQDQKIDDIDFKFLKNRCNQNSLQEKLTASWIRFLRM